MRQRHNRIGKSGTTRCSRSLHQKALFFSIIAVSMTLVFLYGCNCRSKGQLTENPPATTSAPQSVDGKETLPAGITAQMQVLTLQGVPLAGMIPIATRSPNAFDKPIATGPPTNEKGESYIQFPSTEKVALRAWDPKLQFFPNNFFEALPNTGSAAETLVIRMVEASALDAVLTFSDGTPAQRDNAGLMLIHPVYGPWWPAEGNTNERGEVRFAPVPPGKFVLRIKVASGAFVEVPETYIAPGEPTHLGIVMMR